MEEIWIEVGRESFTTRKDLCEAIDSNIKLGWQFYDYTTYPMSDLVVAALRYPGSVDGPGEELFLESPL